MDSPWLEFWLDFRKNKGAVVSLIVILLVIGIAVFAPVITPYDPTLLVTDKLRIPPFWNVEGIRGFVLGTDDIGRDVLSRLIYGARVSFGVGLLVVTLATIFGGLLGIVAGYFEGIFDTIVQRFSDVLMALPSLLLAEVVVSVLGPGLLNSIIAVSILFSKARSSLIALIL